MSGSKPGGNNLSPEFLANSGKGRKPGSKNKMSMAVKEMILEALDNAGGVDYLSRQAEANPPAFLALVGKVLPMQLTGEDGEALIINIRKPDA